MTAGQRRVPWVLWAVLPLLLLLFVGVVAGDRLIGLVRGETGLAGERTYTPPHAVDPGVTVTIDFGAVHAELLPGWLIAWANSGRAGAGEAARARFERLVAAVAADPNLAEIVTEMQTLLPQPVENSDRLLYLTWAWNDYLDTLNVPWRIDANVLLQGDGEGFFYAKCYQVLTDMRVSVAGRELRGRIVERVDSTNVREGYLGHASRFQEGALVLFDRVRDLAIDDVWVMLDPAVDDALEPSARWFAPSIRREVQRALPPEDVALLVATARSRQGLVQARSDIHDRHACGSSLVLNEIPWQGFASAERETFARYARRARGEDCPAILAREAVVLERASLFLQGTGGLRRAVEALIAWVTRGTMVHELRHVADDEAIAGELRARLSCEVCAGLSSRALEEMSAYVASFAHSDARYVSLFQACRLEAASEHGRAMAVLGELVPRLCSDPPADLATVAVDLERKLFGRSDPIELPATYPRVLPLVD